MKTTLQKWGNSLAVRIPKHYADEVEIGEGHPVEVRVHKGRIIVAPTRAKSFTLEELVKGITAKNRHDETDWGSSQGREVC